MCNTIRRAAIQQSMHGPRWQLIVQALSARSLNSLMVWHHPNDLRSSFGAADGMLTRLE
jgi:hypothetical protein